MSFSIVNEPAPGTLHANNDSIFSVVQQTDYDPNNYRDYKAVARVLVNGSEVTRLKSFPVPGTQKMVFDLKNISSSFTKPHFFPQYGLLTTGSIFQRCEASTAEIQLVYGEEYNYNGSWTQYSDQASGNTFVITHASMWRGEEMKNYNPGEVFYPGVASFLTKAKKMKTYPEFPLQFLYYYSVGNSAYHVGIKTYDRANNLLCNAFVPNTYSDDDGMQRVQVGLSALQDLQQVHAYNVISGLGDIYQDGVTDHWEVQLLRESFEPSTLPITIYLDTNCISFANPLQVFWINNLGGFDSFLFNQQNIFSSKKETQSYQKVLGKLIDNEYVVNTYDQSTVSYLNQLTDSIELKKDFLTEEEVLILKGLFASPVIYFRGRDGIFYSATKVDSDDYKLLQKRNGQQKNFSITFNLIPSIGYQTQLQ